jgi:hypothetical protein
MRRPTPLRLPRGARGTSTSVLGPLREVHGAGARAERRQRTLRCRAPMGGLEFRFTAFQLSFTQNFET